MQDRLIFLIGAPRSGTTLLARMLAAHSLVYGRAEPHLVTPIAHLGYFGKVQKAPYDPQNVEQAIHEIVAELPRGEAGYLDALRAYTDSIYDQLMERAPAGKRLFLDKTPAYALVLPFLVRLYPDAKYVVLTRHPLAHHPGERPVPLVWVKYEALVREPEAEFRRVCDHLGVPFEERAIAYGESGEDFKGLGDPTGVARHSRPVTGSVSKWAATIAADPVTLARVTAVLDELDPADLETLGYPRATILAQLEAAKGAPLPTTAKGPLRYRLERRVLVALRRNIHQNALGRAAKRLRFALDVLLRE